MNKRRAIMIAILLLSMLTTIEGVAGARQVFNINRNWKFFSHNETNSDYAQVVNIPHIWNNDALSGRRDYFRGVGNYIRDITVPSQWRGRRVFVRCYGANSISNLLVNGRHVGEHRAGYTTFAYDITDYLKFGEENQFWIMVNNAPQMDLLPIAGDANVYGGIFRDLELVVAGEQMVALNDRGSDGVYVVQKRVTEREAELEVKVMVNGLHDKVVNAEVTIFTHLRDTVATKNVRVRLAGKATSTVVVPISISEPKLWRGIEDPYLYSVGVKIIDGRVVSDSLVVQTGFRSVEYDAERRKVLLNGEPYPVRGVIVTQDRATVGPAITDYQVWEDFKMILDVGANAVRVMGVPHNPQFYRLCDKYGILVCSDFPLVGAVHLTDKGFIETQALRNSAKMQAEEIVKQQFNHPSVIMWGLFSKLNARGDDPLELISQLNMITKREDPSRLTAVTSSEDGKINFISDLVIWDHFFGWQQGTPSDIAIWAKQLETEWNKLKSAVSYGAGGSIYHQSDSLSRPDYLGNWHPERWQTYLHEEYLKQLADSEQFWGVFVGNMFDYGAATRTWGEGRGVNDYGLVTFDRKYHKDAYYLYKANWNRDEPMVYIAERRWSVRGKQLQTIKVYSNRDKVELFINGQSMGEREGERGVFLWENVTLKIGENSLRAVGDGVIDRAVVEISGAKNMPLNLF